MSNMNNLNKCVQSMQAKGVPAEQAAEVVGRIKNVAENAKSKGSANVNAEVAKAIIEDLEKKHRVLQLQKRRAKVNAIRRQQIVDYVTQAEAEGATVVDALEAALVGSDKRFTGSRNSVMSRAQGVKKLWLGSLLNELDNRGLVDLLKKDKDFSGDVMREMVEPGVTGSSKAAEAATVFSSLLERMRLELNHVALTDIGKLDNYAPQTHNSLVMRKVGEDEWSNFVMQRLDMGRTFPDLTPAEAEKVVREIYHTIITGRSLKPLEKKRSTFCMPRSMATRFEEGRVLHFKDANATVEYNEKFGNGRIFENVIDRIEAYANVLALTERFGYNPEMGFNNLIVEYKNKLRRAKDDEGYDKLSKAWRDGRDDGLLSRQFRVLSGEAGTPENVNVARIASTVRAVMAMSKLGGAFLSAFADIGIKTAAARHAGVGWLDSWKTGFDIRLKSLSSKDKVELGRQLGVYVDGLLGELYNKFDVNDNLTGGMSGLMNKFFKVTGLTGWTEGHKAAYAFAMSNRLAEQGAKGLGGMDPDYKAVLEKNGILDLIDLLPYMIKTVEGRRYVVPEAVDQIPVEKIDERVPAVFKRQDTPADIRDRAIDDERENIARRIMSYYADEISYAILEPDAKTRATINRGHKPGTWSGEFFRFAWQFKSFPVTYYQRILKEGRWRRASKISKGQQTISSRITDDPLATVHFFLASAVLGYASMTAKDLSRGKEPRDPREMETVMAALLQGGGLGILGDFMFGEVNRFGNQHTASLVGPVLTEAAGMINILSAAVRGDMETVGETALTTTMNNIPFVNLWYTRMALDYAIQYRLREYMSPGTLRRSERKMKQKFNQEYLKIGGFDFTPSKNIPRGGF